MDKQKRIEEIAEIIRVNCGECNTCKYKEELHCADILSAEELYNAGYRKIPENAVIVSKQVWEEHIENWDKTSKAIEERVRKETAEKFAEMAKELLDKQEKGWSANMIWIITAKNCIDEVCKEITEGKV